MMEEIGNGLEEVRVDAEEVREGEMAVGGEEEFLHGR